MPRISVITIVKNNEKHLPRAMDSVFHQSFTDFEYIIVNDGSTDGTKDVIDKSATKDARVKAKHLPHNVGRAMARNTGLEEAKGRYICFLDSDDYLPVTAFHDLFEVAEKENADVVYGRIKAFDQESGEWERRHYTDWFINHERHHFRLDQHLDLIKDHSIIGRLYRRKTIRKNNVVFSTLRKNGEDVLFAFYAPYYAKRLSMVPHKIVYYYSIGNYLSTANEAKLFDARDNVLEIMEFASKNGVTPLKEKMIWKGAMFASDLIRAQKVYGEDEDNFKKFLETLLPLVAPLTDSIIKTLPSYNQQFARALLVHDFTKAYQIWSNHYNATLKRNVELREVRSNDDVKQIEKEMLTAKLSKRIKSQSDMLRRENIRLAGELDGLYRTRSWRITAPFRFMEKFLWNKQQN